MWDFLCQQNDELTIYIYSLYTKNELLQFNITSMGIAAVVFVKCQNNWWMMDVKEYDQSEHSVHYKQGCCLGLGIFHLIRRQEKNSIYIQFSFFNWSLERIPPLKMGLIENNNFLGMKNIPAEYCVIVLLANTIIIQYDNTCDYVNIWKTMY